MAEWIRVKDKKPEGKSFIVTDGEIVGEAFKQDSDYYWMEDVWTWDNAAPIEGITHWMPLPEPPKEDE